MIYCTLNHTSCPNIPIFLVLPSEPEPEPKGAISLFRNNCVVEYDSDKITPSTLSGSAYSREI